MPNVYGYCRVSHEDSSESGLGVEASLYSIAKWWEYQRENGLFASHAWGSVGWRGERVEPRLPGVARDRNPISKFDRGRDTTDGLFVDEAVSAYKIRLVKRPAGARLAAILQPGDLVIFARLDRAFRDTADFALTVKPWMRKGYQIQFILPNVDLTTAYGMAFAQVAVVFAELESALKSERLKEAQARGRERGQKMGRHVSFGWRQDGWTTRLVGGVSKRVPLMVPDEQEREEVRLIGQWHDIDGVSFADIADRLEVIRAAAEDRSPWPRTPYPGCENRKWNASRCFKAFKARMRVPLPMQKPGVARLPSSTV
jgi:DNA invertase Pin-like site-specific DNA recombinase